MTTLAAPHLAVEDKGMWAALDTIGDCWARMNLTERSFAWIVLIASPLLVLATRSAAPFWFMGLTAYLVGAAADVKRPHYDAEVHRSAFLLWAKLVTTTATVFGIRESFRASRPLDYGFPLLYALIAGWFLGALVLSRLKPSFDFKWRVLRWFDPALPGTPRYRARHPDSRPDS